MDLCCDSGADLGCRRGITEFLPVSSTGHQIIVADLIGFGGERALAFNIIIQLGAILAVIWEYRRKIIDVVVGLPKERQAQKFTVNLLIAFMPAVVLGVAFADLIHEYLFNPITVAAALVIGGIVMLWAERRDHAIRAETVDDMTWTLALKVGFAQCLALVPGTSRSGSTIIGGLLFGLSRKAATEFRSFWQCPPWSVLRSTPATSIAICSSRVTLPCSPSASSLRSSSPCWPCGTAEIHRQPQLCRVCPVPDRFRVADPGDRQLGMIDWSTAVG